MANKVMLDKWNEEMINVNGERCTVYRVANYDHLLGRDMHPRMDYEAKVWYAQNPTGVFYVRANTMKNLMRRLEKMDQLCRW